MGLRWTAPGWLGLVHAWIRARLDERGIALSGAIEQPHVRPWSTVLRVPTERGDVWFKVNTGALEHEAAVVELLTRLRPDDLPVLIATDLRRGWMLQLDAGTRLRELAQGDPTRWEEILPLYAELQLAIADEREALLAAGAPDLGLAALPYRYEQLLTEDEAVRTEAPEPLTDAEVDALRGLAPRVDALCEELAAYGLPETIEHGDLHDGNVFVRDGRYLFLDWGDAAVAHPFCTLEVTLRVLAHHLDVDPASPKLDRFRDAYLEPWSRSLTRSELVAAVEIARALGAICRTLQWHIVIVEMPAPFRAEYAEIVPARLRALLERLSS